MGWRVNGKNLSVTRLMVRGKNADKRLKYMHVGPKGTRVNTPTAVVRVSLPQAEPQPFLSAVIPQSVIDGWQHKTRGEDIVTLPDGERPVTGPHFLVPQIDKCFPDPYYTTGTFTCNGNLLRKLLMVACEVSEDGDKTVRLRICKDLNVMRIDTYRQPGDQEFCGVIKGLDYDGNYIPGEKPEALSPFGKVEKKPQQRAMLLRASTGRKFRGAGE